MLTYNQYDFVAFTWQQYVIMLWHIADDNFTSAQEFNPSRLLDD